MKLDLSTEQGPSWFGAATLGSLIWALEKCDYQARVQFSFCGIAPTTIHSYRGYYEQLAINWDADAENPTVEAFIKTLLGAYNRPFEGYKGGSYRMKESTPVWVDRPDRCSGTGIVAVEADETYCVLKTMKVA